MSIATTRGDGGQTGLAGGVRVSKAAVRVEAYGSVDELNASLGFARSICGDAAIAGLTASIQRELFKVGSALATAPSSPKPQVPIISPLSFSTTFQRQKPFSRSLFLIASRNARVFSRLNGCPSAT